MDSADARAREQCGDGDRTIWKVYGHCVPALHAVVHEHVRHPVHELLELPARRRNYVDRECTQKKKEGLIPESIKLIGAVVAFPNECCVIRLLAGVPINALDARVQLASKEIVDLALSKVTIHNLIVGLVPRIKIAMWFKN